MRADQQDGAAAWVRLWQSLLHFGGPKARSGAAAVRGILGKSVHDHLKHGKSSHVHWDRAVRKIQPRVNFLSASIG